MHQPHSNLGQRGMCNELESWPTSWTNVGIEFYLAFWKSRFQQNQWQWQFGPLSNCPNMIWILHLAILPQNYEPQILSIWVLDMQQIQMAKSSCIGAILHVSHLHH